MLERSLKMKDEGRKIEDIPAAELNGHISEFIISVRTKDGNEYKPTSLQSLMASFERQLEKQGKGNKPKASVALTREDLKILYEKCLLGMCSPEALF